MTYEEFLQTKKVIACPTGFDVEPSELNQSLLPFQCDIVKWAVKRGKAALFTMTGTGKTIMQLAWADAITNKIDRDVLILTPLAVAEQTIEEGLKFGIKVHGVRKQEDVGPGLNIANYEILHHFDPSRFGAIVLDESSILKSFDGKTRKQLMEFSKDIPYKLACTATPSPNDYMELGNHSEFLGIMSYVEMLATYFVHDGADTAKWRLKGHAETEFWKWLASWGVFLCTPSDLGYSNEGFELPELITHEHVVPSMASEGMLFAMEVRGLSERRGARKESLERRVKLCCDIVANSPKPFMVWCGLNIESELLKKSIPCSVEVKGSDTDEHKKRSLLDFAHGKIDVLISKSSIAGFGMNWQVCSNTAFVGVSDSFEMMFQATKRFHRKGQKNTVNRHFITSEAEGSVIANIKRKERDFMAMIGNMVQHTKDITQINIKSAKNEKNKYTTAKIKLPEWIKEGGY